VADTVVLAPGASTTVTATLYDATMARIAETRTLSFTSDLGIVTPAVVDTVDGGAVVTFTAGGTPGQATVWATTGEITGTARIQVLGRAPEARFSADPLSGLRPLTVSFVDQSAYGPTEWAWDLGDGTTSTERHPTHTYDRAGSYTVTLTVSNALGSDTRIEPAYISVAPNEAPTARDDQATTLEDTPVTILVLDNDDDPDGHALTVVSVEGAAHGEAHTDGSSVIYTPDPN